jgi:DNA-binding NtrC family response regulator
MMEENQALQSEKLHLFGLAAIDSGRPAHLPRARIQALKVLILALMKEVEASAGRTETDQTAILSLSDEVRCFESELIKNTLAITGGRQRPAARLLRMKVTTLHAKIRRYGIDIADDAREQRWLHSNTL